MMIQRYGPETGSMEQDSLGSYVTFHDYREETEKLRGLLVRARVYITDPCSDPNCGGDRCNLTRDIDAALSPPAATNTEIQTSKEDVK